MRLRYSCKKQRRVRQTPAVCVCATKQIETESPAIAGIAINITADDSQRDVRCRSCRRVLSPIDSRSSAHEKLAFNLPGNLRAAALAGASLILHTLAARRTDLTQRPMPEHGAGYHDSYAKEWCTAGSRPDYGTQNTADRSDHDAEAKKQLG